MVLKKIPLRVPYLLVFQAAVVSEGVARWEDNKKWQQKVETLRGKLADKTRELEKAEKTITMLREAVNRAEKDKSGLHSRLKRRVVLTLFPLLSDQCLAIRMFDAFLLTSEWRLFRPLSFSCLIF